MKMKNSRWDGAKSEALLVAHTTLLEIPCHGSNIIMVVSQHCMYTCMKSFDIEIVKIIPRGHNSTIIMVC